MCQYISLSYKAWKGILNDQSTFDEDSLNKVLKRSTDLCAEIMDCLAIEELSEENTNLKNRLNSKIASSKTAY